MFNIPFIGEGIKNIFKKPLTSEEDIDNTRTAENYRGRLKFDENKCIGCGLCIRVCAGGAITKTVKKVEEGQEIIMNFDLYSCTFCGMCQDFCPKKAITLSDDAMMVETDKENLRIGGSFIKKIPQKVNVKPKETVK